MNRCTIRFIRKQGSSSNDDDVLRVFDNPDSDTYFRLTFRPANQDHKKAAEFHLDAEDSLDYIRSVLKALTYDTYPFEEIQVDTAIHPSILYHVSDLDSGDTRRDVMTTIEDALRHDITLVRE